MQQSTFRFLYLLKQRLAGKEIQHSKPATNEFAAVMKACRKTLLINRTCVHILRTESLDVSVANSQEISQDHRSCFDFKQNTNFNLTSQTRGEIFL